ncbi:MAG: AAA family ATPase, partial [Cyanobacteria bacterium J06641_5]
MPNGAKQKSTTPHQLLAELGRDLTADARANRLDPTIGRDEEIRRTIQILSRRTKNNPVLIGEPGVGKTAIAEGLAQRIASGDVPQSLRDRQLIGLDIGALVAGTKYVGTLEERLRDILKEVTDSQGQIILFIDEVHTIVGAGASENSSMDVANLLKPMLARGELRCIGATTPDEYRQYIEKDTALERRFQQVYVEQPSVEDAVSILRGLKERYEVHHGVRITDSALVAAAMLSKRYISDRFLPDKAIDLIDEAAAQLKMELTSKPIAIDEVDRKIVQLEMERLSLQKEPDTQAQERCTTIETELEASRATQKDLSDRWEAEKNAIASVQAAKAEIDRVHLEITAAKRDYNLTLAAELEYGKLARLQEQLHDLESNLSESQIDGKNLLR